MLHSLKAAIDWLFKRSPAGPSPSIFGPRADRMRSEKAAQDELDMATEIEKGRMKGF